MTKTETTEVASFEALEDRYDIIGELGGRRDVRTMMARRRDDGADVLVSVFRDPGGDEGNALSHLASDANRLAQHAHPNLLRVHEARWLSNDTLALVTDRVRYPALEELLIRRNEEFSPPRVAMVLRDINSAVEWARDQKIVHRHVNPSSVFVEPGSDRVLLSFVLRPLPLAEMPGPEDDARTIATLARAMLTRSVADPERDRLPLGELRPGLPDRLIEQTDALLNPDAEGKAPDIAEYIATVAMSEALKRGEMECAVTTRKLLEEERVARDKIEAERQATERAAAEQARLFQLEREAFAKEREGILGELQKQREALERERAALARERAEHQEDRDVLVREREEHRRWADEVERAFAAQTAALAQQARAARDRIADERAEIDRIVEARVAQELAARLPRMAEDDATERVVPVAAPKRRKAKDTQHEIAVPSALPPRPKQHRVKPEWVRSISHAWAGVRDRMSKWGGERRPRWNRKWNMPVRVAAVLLLVVFSAVAIARGRDGDGRVAQAPVGANRITDSAAGRVEARSTASRVDPSGLPADFVRSVRRAREAGVPADFVGGVRARSDSGTSARGTFSQGEDGMVVYTPPARRAQSSPTPAPVRPQAAQPVRRDTLSAARRQTAAPVDTLFGLPTPYIPPAPVPQRDTIRRDTLPRPRPDTIPVMGVSHR
jgi:hypothetical protein